MTISKINRVRKSQHFGNLIVIIQGQIPMNLREKWQSGSINSNDSSLKMTTFYGNPIAVNQWQITGFVMARRLSGRKSQHSGNLKALAQQQISMNLRRADCYQVQRIGKQFLKVQHSWNLITSFPTDCNESVRVIINPSCRRTSSKKSKEMKM